MKNNKGFTLLEIIISITLMSILVVMVVIAIQLARRGETKATERQQLLQIKRSLYRSIVTPLRGIYPYYKKDEKGRPVLRFSGGPDSVEFVTTYTEPWRQNLANTPGLRWIRLYLDVDELKIKENLFFVEEPEKGASEILLYRGIEELHFEYLDSEQDIWLEDWPEEKGRLPAAIRVKVSFNFEGRTHELPPIVVQVKTLSQKKP